MEVIFKRFSQLCKIKYLSLQDKTIRFLLKREVSHWSSTFRPHRPPAQRKNLSGGDFHFGFTPECWEFSSASVSVAGKKNVSSKAVSVGVFSWMKDTQLHFSSARVYRFLLFSSPHSYGTAQRRWYVNVSSEHDGAAWQVEAHKCNEKYQGSTACLN